MRNNLNIQPDQPPYNYGLNDQDEFSGDVLLESNRTAPVEIGRGGGRGRGGHGHHGGHHGGRGRRRGGGVLYGGPYGLLDFPFGTDVFEFEDNAADTDRVVNRIAQHLKERSPMNFNGENGIHLAGFGTSQIELAGGVVTPWDAFESEPVRVGNDEIGNDEIGNDEIGNIEIGNIEIGAVRAVVKKARDNRRPAPKMRAVDKNSPLEPYDDWGLTDVFIGSVTEAAPDPFPLATSLMVQFGAGAAPRYVRIDTEESYKKFRAKSSPEMEALRRQIDEVRTRLANHEADPDAHEQALDDIETLTAMGEDLQQSQAAKRIDLLLPPRFKGTWDAWQEGDMLCASIVIPGSDGAVRICTSVDSARKFVEEMARHASEANVPMSAVLGALPAMGVNLGAGTIIKEMAAAAGSILQRPEASGKQPFTVRIEPKANPALCALAALAQMCAAGNSQACDEWSRLSALGPSQVKQAMSEALQLVKNAAAPR